MNSAKAYPSAIPWEQMSEELREYWTSHWEATKERLERMRGNSPD